MLYDGQSTEHPIGDAPGLGGGRNNVKLHLVEGHPQKIQVQAYYHMTADDARTLTALILVAVERAERRKPPV